MDADPQTVQETPWYLRVKTLVITAGALAVALLGILNFWDRIFPPNLEDNARIESIERLKMTPLSDFASDEIGTDVYLPLPEGAVPSDHTVRSVVRVSDTIDSTPTPETNPPPSSTLTPTPTPTPTLPSPSPSPATPTPTSTEAPAARIRPSEDYVRDVTEQSVFRTYVQDVPRHMMRIRVPETVDQDGNLVAPEEAAAELVEALEDIELENSPMGVDALGWTVAVGLDLKGLADEPLLLTWSLDGAGVADSWAADNFAYRIIATTEHDTGTVKIWVPDLKGPNPYNVNVDLVHESDGSPADSATPLEIP
jgi:hypothetical protein